MNNMHNNIKKQKDEIENYNQEVNINFLIL